MNGKRVNPDGVKFSKYRRGIYGSYGDRDLKTYQTKVPRETFEKFDDARKVHHMCKNEILEHVMKYYIEVIAVERKDLAGEKRIVTNTKYKRSWEQYKKQKYIEHLQPLVTNGITTDLENGVSIDANVEMQKLDKIFNNVKGKEKV